jgi:hypothetical protein
VLLKDCESIVHIAITPNAKNLGRVLINTESVRLAKKAFPIKMA